jgi:hypothetical protein
MESRIKGFRDFKEVNESSVVLTKEQMAWLDACTKDLSSPFVKSTWKLNVLGQVDVSADFNCGNDLDLTDFKGVQFGTVFGSFYCFNCENLKSLVGSPRKVKYSFNCRSCNSLKSLAGAPDDVKGLFVCDNCPDLESLAGAPLKMSLLISCGDCPKLPQEEVELAKDQELFKMWLESKLPVKEFLEKKRGTIQGRKYGI